MTLGYKAVRRLVKANMPVKAHAENLQAQRAVTV